MRTEARAGLGAVVALVACILWVHEPGLTGPAHLTAHHDNLDGTAPLRVEAARQWRSGHVPLWNPWKRSGMPLLADTTAGAMYPGNAPFLFVDPAAAAAGDSPVFRALDQVAAINAVLAGLFMYVFLRSIALARVASVLGALVYAGSGTMGWFAAWYMQIQSSVVWLPLILAAVRGAGGEKAASWTTAGALAVALQFFAGFPETSFYSGVLAIGYAASLAAGGRSLGPFASVGGIYVAGVLLAAVQLLPSLELQSVSRRPGELPLEVFQSLPASIAMVKAWVLPGGPAGFEFPPLAAYHVGAVAAVLAALGAVLSLRRAAFFVVVFAIGFVLSLGAATPASAWLHQLPVFSAFRHPFKHLFEVSFAMAVLAAFGTQRLLGLRGDAAQGATPLRNAIGIAAIAITCVLLRANQRVLIDANPAAVDTSGTRPQVVSRIEPGWRVLTARQVFQKRDAELLIGDYPSQFEVAAIHGAGPFLWAPMAEATGMIEEETSFRDGLFDARDRTLALLSGRYLVQTKQKERFGPAVDASAWNVVAETADSRLLERRDALARLRFTGSVRCADASGIEASLRAGSPEPGEVALLDCKGRAAPAGPFHPPSSLALRVEKDEPGALVVATDVPDGAGAFLVVGQSDFPAWRAAVDGQPVEIRRVHGLVQGIELPSGTKRVELRYLPAAYLIGAALSAATLIVLLLWNFVVWGSREEA